MNNPLEKVSDVGDVISRAVSIASTKKEQIIKQAMNGVLLFTILLVFGCLDFATLKFHAEYLLTVGYWGTTISKTIAGICAFNIGINVMWEVELKKDFVLAMAIAKYNILKKQINKHFEFFVERVYNPKEKKAAYLSQINKKIYMLNRFSRQKDRLLYDSELPENQKKKLKNRYCIKRKELEDLKNPEFIERNINSLKVKYIEVFPQVFQMEIDGSPVIRGTKTRGNVGVGKLKATGTVLLGMVGFSMFVTSFGLELNREQFEDQMEAFWHYLLKCAEDVAVILWQTFQGMLRVKKIISGELTQPYVGRNTVLEAFLEWELEQNYITKEEYDKVMDDIKKIELKVSENIEVTEEEYNRMKGDR